MNRDEKHEETMKPKDKNRNIDRNRDIIRERKREERGNPSASACGRTCTTRL